ncbi:MAG: hypothetical protein ABIG28_00890 [archaeon]
MGNRIGIKTLALAFVIILVITSSVLAFGISSPYWKDNPLEMYPGEVREIPFNLQNCPSMKDHCDGKDAKVVVAFEEGGEIAEITSGLDYLIPYGTADMNLMLKVSIPADANIGDDFYVKFSASASSTEEGGNIQVGTKYNVGFPVKVVEKVEEPPVTPPTTEEKGMSATMIAIIVVVVVVILYFLFRKKKEPEEEQDLNK